MAVRLIGAGRSWTASLQLPPDRARSPRPHRGIPAALHGRNDRRPGLHEHLGDRALQDVTPEQRGVARPGSPAGLSGRLSATPRSGRPELRFRSARASPGRHRARHRAPTGRADGAPRSPRASSCGRRRTPGRSSAVARRSRHCFKRRVDGIVRLGGSPRAHLDAELTEKAAGLPAPCQREVALRPRHPDVQKPALLGDLVSASSPAGSAAHVPRRAAGTRHRTRDPSLRATSAGGRPSGRAPSSRSVPPGRR